MKIEFLINNMYCVPVITTNNIRPCRISSFSILSPLKVGGSDHQLIRGYGRNNNPLKRPPILYSVYQHA